MQYLTKRTGLCWRELRRARQRAGGLSRYSTTYASCTSSVSISRSLDVLQYFVGGASLFCSPGCSGLGDAAGDLGNENKDGSGVSVQLVTFTILRKFPWMREVHQRHWYTTPWRHSTLPLSWAKSRPAGAYGEVLVIFDPWIPAPAIRPFWLKINA